jgi:hypothetical protein
MIAPGTPVFVGRETLDSILRTLTMNKAEELFIRSKNISALYHELLNGKPLQFESSSRP